MPADQELIDLTAEIVSAYVGNNMVVQADVPALIVQVHAALAELSVPPAPQIAEAAELKPAVPVRKSVTPEYIVCLEDGKRFKSLKRHLRTKYDLSPEAYRAKWGLPPDYPMVAPAYAEARSRLAKKIGLGRGGAGAVKAS